MVSRGLITEVLNARCYIDIMQMITFTLRKLYTIGADLLFFFKDSFWQFT